MTAAVMVTDLCAGCGRVPCIAKTLQEQARALAWQEAEADDPRQWPPGDLIDWLAEAGVDEETAEEVLPGFRVLIATAVERELDRIEKERAAELAAESSGWAVDCDRDAKGEPRW